MFKVKAPEVFDATLTIVGQGREQKLKLKYRHLLKDAYKALVDKLAGGELAPAQVILDMVAEWDADVDLDTEGVELALQNQIGLDTAIIHGYAQAIQVARKGN
ncbi:phage tail assembly chaperone [Stenotrophomonas sp.]|uniref:phage tail assembly chaperone n=1 Tax=Stenotrophomonas sp. TaxID=69392 RepID=UPI0028AD3E59|nr:phage tail assembly chaperone [Stenotrophomonas sp.]